MLSQKEKEILLEALESATRLANDAKGLDWGSVSNLGCDLAYDIERVLSGNFSEDVAKIW